MFAPPSEKYLRDRIGGGFATPGSFAAAAEALRSARASAEAEAVRAVCLEDELAAARRLIEEQRGVMDGFREQLCAVRDELDEHQRARQVEREVADAERSMLSQQLADTWQAGCAL